MTTVIADAITPIVGWRSWEFHKVGDRVCLKSQVRHTLWSPGMVVEAVCFPIYGGYLSWDASWGRFLALTDYSHSAPRQTCSCGIYAMKSLALFRKHWPPLAHIPGGNVIGRVAMWGKVIEHDSGYRAQFAYPTVFYTPGGLRWATLGEFGVPILSVDELEPEAAAA